MVRNTTFQYQAENVVQLKIARRMTLEARRITFTNYRSYGRNKVDI